MKNFLFVFFLLTYSVTSHSQVNLDSGLVAYYQFNGDANDASGNGNNASFNNATLTSDRTGTPNSAYYFNGVDNFIQIPNSASLVPQELTLFAVVKPLGFYLGACYNSCIIDKGSPDYISGDYSLRFTQAAFSGNDCNNPDTLHQNFTGYSYLNNSAPLYTPYVTYNTYYCIAYTVSADSLKLYVDGNLKWKERKVYEIGVNTQDLFLGRKDDSNYPYWFKGVMDEIRIYNRAINDLEVASLCASVLPVTLTEFEAYVADKKIQLDWNVENNYDIRNFIVERSLTGHSNFVPIGTIASRNTHTYSFEDASALPNQNYFYRLAILQNNGGRYYSGIKTAKITLGNRLMVVYPNPSNGLMLVKNNGYKGKIKLKISNSVGQIVSEETKLVSTGDDLPIRLAKQLRGIFWVKIITDDQEFTEKVLVR